MSAPIVRFRARQQRSTRWALFTAWHMAASSAARVQRQFNSLFDRQGGRRLQHTAFFVWRRKITNRIIAADIKQETAHVHANAAMARRALRPWIKRVAANRRAAATAGASTHPLLSST